MLVWTVLAVAALQQIWMASALTEGHVGHALEYYGVACENQRLHVFCPRGFNVKFLSAMYGRTGLDHCTHNYTTGEHHNSTTCRLDLLDEVVTRCLGLEECVLNADELTQDDPCPGTSKYLHVDFDCIGDGHVGHALEYYGVACENWILHAYCPRGYLIEIIDAMYGRTGLEECIDNYDAEDVTNATTCRLDIKNEVMDLCEGKDECKLSVDRLDLPDPCPGTSKYLQVTFDCAELSYSGLQCQGNLVNLECAGSDEYLISVKSVFYGRLDNQTCSDDATILTNECSGSRRALDVIADLCDYKQECPVTVVPELLDDPCVGTTKYLDVHYSCILCENQNPSGDDHCELWASIGECEKNYDWMLAFCRKSCTQCHREVTCVDEHEDCQSWASIGECFINPRYMLEYCKYACDVCPMSSGSPPAIPDHAETTIVCEYDSGSLSCPSGEVLHIYYATYGRDDSTTCSDGSGPIYTTDCDSETFVFRRVQTICSGRQDCQLSPRTPELGDPCPGTHKYLTVYHTCRSCGNAYAKEKPEDGDRWCELWEIWGECHENPEWMWENCFQACSGCKYAECANTLQEPDVDADVRCDEWALMNQCVLNRAWMEDVCLKSCRNCPRDTGTQTTLSSGVTTTVPETSSPKTTVTTPGTRPTISSDYITDLACEGSYLGLYCDDIDQHIYVVEGFYGRWDATYCSGRRTDLITGCVDRTFPDKAVLLCNRHSQCFIEVQSGKLGDPCDQPTYKYANVSYVCVDDTPDDSYFTGLCPSGCGDHGRCVAPDLCRCDVGYTGATCEQYDCTQTGGSCGGNGICMISTGHCQCDQGFTGPTCEECSDGFTGPDCEPVRETSTPATSTRATTEPLSTASMAAAPRTLSMTIVLDVAWKDSYMDISEKDTRKFILSIKQKLFNFYSTAFEDLKDVEIFKLSPGSVVVDHALHFNYYLDDSTMERYSCLITKSLDDSGNKIGDTTAYLDAEIVEACTECHHDGVFKVRNDGFWYCQCDEGYTGRLCEEVTKVDSSTKHDDDGNTQTIVIIAIVVVSVLLLVGCVVLFVYIRRKNKRLQEDLSEDTSNGLTSRVTYDRMAASATVEYPQQDTGHLPKESYVNHAVDVNTPDILQK